MLGGGIQAPAQRREQGAADEQRPIVGVRAIDDQPRRFAGAGGAQHVPGDLAIAVVLVVVVPVALGDAPARARVLLERLQPRLLPVLGQMEPELHQQHAFAREHGLEAADLVQALVELGLLAVLAHPLADRLGVPVVEHHADPAARRQRPPEAPHEGALGLLGGGRVEGPGLDVARIHPFVEQVDGLALAGLVHTVDQDHDGKLLELEQIELGIEQLGAQTRHRGAKAFVVGAVAEFGGFEH